MRDLGLEGARRGKKVRTTIRDDGQERAGDLLKRDFTASRPNERWVADFTYVATWSGIVYVAFVVAVFSRAVVGWSAATSKRAKLVLDALDMALWRRDHAGTPAGPGLVHHSGAGSHGGFNRSSQHLDCGGVMGRPAGWMKELTGRSPMKSPGAPSLRREVEREFWREIAKGLLSEEAAAAVGDALDNALMESQIGLYKTELIKPRKPWHGLADVELATAEWVDWFNNQRLHTAIGDIPPHEHEINYYAQTQPQTAAGVNA
jgi:putative transposase